MIELTFIQWLFVVDRIQKYALENLRDALDNHPCLLNSK
jgi:hypothetical protein